MRGSRYDADGPKHAPTGPTLDRKETMQQIGRKASGQRLLVRASSSYAHHILFGTHLAADFKDETLTGRCHILATTSCTHGNNSCS